MVHVGTVGGTVDAAAGVQVCRCAGTVRTLVSGSLGGHGAWVVAPLGGGGGEGLWCVNIDVTWAEGSRPPEQGHFVLVLQRQAFSGWDGWIV